MHGEHATTARAADLTLDKFLDPATLDQAAGPPRPPTTVLLTGANGFLGRFLCLDWLKRLAPTGGTLVCLVRGTDDADARRRLDEAFDSGDAELKAEYAELSGGLQVVAGDLGSARLGLAEPTWRRLAETVDLVVHPVALVNHVLPYHQLFGPNVAGTAEVIRLALTERLKPVTYLSTVAVSTRGTVVVDETADIRTAVPERAIDESHANGYVTGKWAGEVLLREAHDRYGLPVTVFRSDMILAHSRYAGQLNVPDAFTRLVLSVLATGLAPRSFYRGDDPARPHYDGLPVDFIAEAVATLSASEPGYRTFNVVNPHDDNVSLDTFVDWLIATGAAIERIEDHRQWHERFTVALRALPEKQRQDSLLPLVHDYRSPITPVAGSAVPGTRFREAVRDAGIGPDIPHVSRALIEKYVADLRGLGLL
ncbi:thioester reductase domain-containing protein [Amycolatopsis sp. NPDC004368]